MVWLVAGTTFLSALREGAERAPDRPAVTCGPVTLTRAEFLGKVERLAGLFESRGVTNGSSVSIGLPNSVDFVVAMFAAWAVGAVPQPVSSRLPAAELAALLDVARPSLVVGVPEATAGEWPVLESVPAELPVSRFTPSMSPELKAVASGGSTGRPKLIVTTAPAAVEPSAAAAALLGMRPGGQVLMPGPLYHNGPFSLTAAAIGTGNHVVLMPRFDALQTDDLGNIPYAIVDLSAPASDEELLAHLRQRLVSYKLPRVIERATTPLRDDAGKVRRSALRAERIAQARANAKAAD